ncbi:MAG: glycosyltransferase family 39 protein [Calditrichaeota bacterium]|nr:glycosyltransferase family 39 protein [Calditrichota bacterium]MCB9391310.1 glycosyltransferase family 39 protein [Calditrichota bacterium]
MAYRRKDSYIRAMKAMFRDPWFWLIAALAVALRVWHLLHAMGSPTFLAPAVDPLWYHQAAERVAHGAYGPWPLFRAPLYPILLGWTYKPVANDLLWARILNILLQTAALAVVYSTARDYFGTLAARIASLFFAVNGMLIFFSGETLSTSLEVLLGALCAQSVLALSKSQTPRHAALAGVIWGLAAITRPNFLLVAPVALLFALRRQSLTRSGAAALAALLLPILPVTIANFSLGGEPVLIATQGGVNFWIGNNPSADGITSTLPGADRFWTMEQAKELADRTSGRDLAPGALSDFYYEKGRNYVSEHPLDALKLMVRKSSLFFNRFEVSNNKHISYFAAQTPGLLILILLNFALLLPFAVTGLWAAQRSESRLLWSLVLVYALSVILFFIASRFRMPVVPWLTVLAGAGVAAMLKLRGARLAISAMAAVVVLLLTLSNPYRAHEAPESSARYMEGNAYLALANYDSAQVCFREAANNPELRKLATLNLGVAQQRAKHENEARFTYLKLLRDFPDYAPAFNNLGSACEAVKDTVSALDAYRRAIALDPAMSDAKENLAKLLLELGKHKLRWGDSWGAQVPLKESIAVLPTASGYYHLAVAHGQSMEYDQGVEALAHALELDPSYDPAVTLKRQLELALTGVKVPRPEIK